MRHGVGERCKARGPLDRSARARVEMVAQSAGLPLQARLLPTVGFFLLTLRNVLYDIRFNALILMKSRSWSGAVALLLYL